MSHKATRITIKSGEVDDEIIPVVEWLNSFDDIYTRWSCQGEEIIRIPQDRPMVVFYCESNLTLATVLGYLRTFSEVECEFFEQAGSVRYIIWFKDKEALKLFIQKIPTL